MELDMETRAIRVAFDAIKPLSPGARKRVVEYLHNRLVKDEIDRAVSIVMMLHSIGKLKAALDQSPIGQKESGARTTP